MLQPSTDKTTGTGDPLLRLDPDSLMLSGKDSLQLINRRGAFDLHAKNLQHLHQLFAPHLDGSRRESELVSAVAAHQTSAVRSYLKTLRQSGALVEVPSAPPAAGLSLDVLGAGHPAGCFQVDETTVHISLNGKQQPSSLHFLAFMSPLQATAWLSTLRRTEGFGPSRHRWQTIVVAPEPQSREQAPQDSKDLDRRAIIARWLLSSAAGPQDGLGRLQIFRLAATGASLERLAMIGAGAGNGDAGRVDQQGDGTVGLATLPDQLGLITSDDREQLPLVVARARRPLFDNSQDAGLQFGSTHSEAPARQWRYGLHFEAVREALLVSRLADLAAQSPEPRPFYAGKLGDPMASYRRVEGLLEGQHDLPILHARNRQELLVALLEQRELQRHERNRRSAGPNSADLLSLPGDDRIQCVQRLLSLRFRTLPAYPSTTPRGATVWRLGNQRACSFFPERALLEILLRALYQSVYAPSPNDEPAAPAVPYDATPTDLARVLGRFPHASVVLRGVSIWGRTIWSGQVVEQGNES